MATSPRSQEVVSDDPNFAFFRQCYLHNIPVMSILQKMQQKALHLVGYNLNDHICKAFYSACQKYPDFIESILLDNNGLKDSGTQEILKSICSLTVFKRIVIKNNEITSNVSLGYLKELLERKPDYHLEELRLNNCKLGGSFVETLLDVILK